MKKFDPAEHEDEWLQLYKWSSAEKKWKPFGLQRPITDLWKWKGLIERHPHHRLKLCKVKTNVKVLFEN